MLWRVQNKEATQSSIKEAILQLFRMNFDFCDGTTYEIDGIVCITARTSAGADDQLIVKLHDNMASKFQANHKTGSDAVCKQGGPSAADFSDEHLAASGGVLRDYLTSRSSPLVDQSVLQRLASKALISLPNTSSGAKLKLRDENDNRIISAGGRSIEFRVMPTSDENSDRFKTASTRIQSQERKALINDGALDLHMSGTDASLSCTICATVFDSRALLAAHLDTAHGCSIDDDDNEMTGLHLDGEGSQKSIDSPVTNSAKRRKQSNPRRGLTVENLSTDPMKLSDECGEISDTSVELGIDSVSDGAHASSNETLERIDKMEGITAADASTIDISMQSGSEIIRSLLRKHSADRNGLISGTSKNPPGLKITSGISVLNEAALRIGGKVSDEVAAHKWVAVRAEGKIGGTQQVRGAQQGPSRITPAMAKRQYDVDREWKCPHCFLVTKGFEAYSEHCRLAHKRHACPYCMQTFSQRVNRDRHLYNHTGEKPYDCAECGYGFTRRDALRKHQQRTNHAIGGEVATDLSSTSGTAGSAARKKMTFQSGTYASADLKMEENGWRSKWNAEEGKSEEEENDVGLDLSISRTSRDSSEWSGIVPMPEENSRGENCWDEAQELIVDRKRKYDDGDERSITSRAYAGYTEPRSASAALALTASIARISNQSGRSTPSAKRVSTPVSEINQSCRSYRCDVCGVTTIGSELYIEHCKTAHRRTPCIYCARTFSQKGNMERHMRQHTGERPFRCEFCSSAYTRKETLKAHVLQAHGEEGGMTSKQGSPFSDGFVLQSGSGNLRDGASSEQFREEMRAGESEDRSQMSGDEMLDEDNGIMMITDGGEAVIFDNEIDAENDYYEDELNNQDEFNITREQDDEDDEVSSSPNTPFKERIEFLTENQGLGNAEIRGQDSIKNSDKSDTEIQDQDDTESQGQDDREIPGQASIEKLGKGNTEKQYQVGIENQDESNGAVDLQIKFSTSCSGVNRDSDSNDNNSREGKISISSSNGNSDQIQNSSCSNIEINSSKKASEGSNSACEISGSEGSDQSKMLHKHEESV